MTTYEITVMIYTCVAVILAYCLGRHDGHKDAEILEQIIAADARHYANNTPGQGERN